MLYYITLVLVFWSLIYTAARFLQYFRIVKNYKEETQATVRQIRDHEPAGRKEPPALDVLLSYEIAGEERSSEIVVPREQAAEQPDNNPARKKENQNEQDKPHARSDAVNAAPRRH